MFEKLASWLEKNSLPCYYKKYLGTECPGCGMQRSFIELLRGDLTESFRLYPALTTTILLFVFLVLHLIFKFRNGAKYLLFIFILNTFIVLVQYFIKLFN